MRSNENVTGAPENVTLKDVAATSGQVASVVVIEDSVAPTTEAAVGAMLADVRAMQITGAVGSQRSTRGADAYQEEEEEATKVASGLGRLVVLSATEAAVVAAPAQVGNDGMARVKKMIKKLIAENLALHGQ